MKNIIRTASTLSLMALVLPTLSTGPAMASAMPDSVAHRCLTPYTLDFEAQRRGEEAKLDWNSPDAPSFGSFEEAINARPTLSGTEHTLESNRFVLHYTTEGDDAVTEAQAEAAFESIGFVWMVEHDQMDYPYPPEDGMRGGDSRYDYYFTAQRFTYGVTYAEDWLDDNTATSYIALGSWMNELEIQVTVAHEHFHAIHFTMDGREETWLFETSATWMEDQVYDDINDYYNYVPSTMNEPGEPLSSTSVMYANSIWWLYMTQHYGQSLVQDVWFETSGSDTQVAMQTTSDMGDVYGYDFAEALQGWREAFVDTSRFEEGAAYGDVAPTATASFPLDTQSGSLAATASAIILIPSESGGSTTLTVSLGGSDTMTAGLLLINSSGDWIDAPGGDAGMGDSKVWTVTNFGASYEQAMLVISNGDPYDSDSYSVTIETPGWSGGGDGGGGGCDSTGGGQGALLGLAMLLLPAFLIRRRD